MNYTNHTHIMDCFKIQTIKKVMRVINQYFQSVFLLDSNCSTIIPHEYECTQFAKQMSLKSIINGYLWVGVENVLMRNLHTTDEQINKHKNPHKIKNHIPQGMCGNHANAKTLVAYFLVVGR